MEIITKPTFRLTLEEKELIHKIINFSIDLESTCDDIGECDNCPVCGACQYFNFKPENLRKFCCSLLDASD